MHSYFRYCSYAPAFFSEEMAVLIDVDAFQ